MWGVTEITDGCIKNDYLLIGELRSLFPPDVFGGPTKESAAKTVRIHWGGEPVDTDLVSSDGAFRARSWVGEFIRTHGLRVGDRVVVQRVSPYVFHVYPVRVVGLGIQSPG